MKWFKEVLAVRFDINGQIIGEWDEQNQARIRTLKFLGRRITKVSSGYEWEADPKHVQILLEELGMTDCKAVDLPMAKSSDVHDAAEREQREPTRRQVSYFAAPWRD